MKINNKNAKKNKTYKKLYFLAVVFVALIGFGVYGVIKASDYVASWEESIRRESFEIGHFSGLTEGYNAAKEEDWEMLSSNKEIVELLKQYFPDYAQARIMAAVLQHESQFKVNAKSYNCYYTKLDKNGKPVKYSTFCKKGDEHKAWSVDCGIAMLNYHGKVCPAYTMDPKLALAKTKSMVEKRGFQPWVSYTSGAYKQYLK